MKTIYITIALSLLFKVSISQNSTLCADLYFFPEEKPQRKSDETCLINESGNMYKKVEKLMQVAGLPMNFVVCKTGKTSNAFAAIDKNGIRYIKYDDQFLKKLNSDTTALESMIILAHEVGHHLSGHTILMNIETFENVFKKYCIKSTPDYDEKRCNEERIKYYENSQKQELEADRFAGYIMFRYGAKFEQISNLYKRLGKYYSTRQTYSHPDIPKRIEAVKEGYDLASSNANSNKTLDIQTIRGKLPNFVFNNTSKLDRNKIINNIVIETVYGAARLVTKDTRYSFGLSHHQPSFQELSQKEIDDINKYLGKKIKTSDRNIDDDVDFFEVYQMYIGLSGDNRVVYRPQYAFHIKGGIFKIILLDKDALSKVLYSCPFIESQISKEEIKSIFVEIFRIGLQKEIAKYY